VQEGGYRFLVNLRDRLDTGLYLDQRLVRAEIAALARGRRFLNLFAYTASATVYAAKGGATASTSVDLSSSALRWARRNLEANGIDLARHELVRAECSRWLREARGRYGVVLLAPPVYSRSKAMEGDLDIARDHPALLERCAALLEPDGVILFVTHARKLELALPRGLAAEEISGRTVPPDFARSPHRAWLVRRVSSRSGS
jgi:23S rRNA (guanine2445-N2)-methyltransferase / 23S rRNA (guanine2069-N7)-methyltransferase